MSQKQTDNPLSQIRIGEFTLSEILRWYADSNPEHSEAYATLERTCGQLEFDTFDSEEVALALRASKDAENPYDVFFLVLYVLGLKQQDGFLQEHADLECVLQTKAICANAQALLKTPPRYDGRFPLKDFWAALRILALNNPKNDWENSVLWLRGLAEYLGTIHSHSKAFLTPTRLYLTEEAVLASLERGWRFLGVSRPDQLASIKTLIRTGLIECHFELIVASEDRSECVHTVAVDVGTLDSIWHIVPIDALRKNSYECLAIRKGRDAEHPAFESYRNFDCVFRIPDAFPATIKAQIRKTLAVHIARIRASRLLRSAYVLTDKTPRHKLTHPIVGLFVPLSMVAFLGEDRNTFLASLEQLLEVGAVYRLRSFSLSLGPKMALESGFCRAAETVVEKFIPFNEKEAPTECGIVFLNRDPSFRLKDQTLFQRELHTPRQGWMLPQENGEGDTLQALPNARHRTLHDLSRDLVQQAYHQNRREAQ